MLIGMFFLSGDKIKARLAQRNTDAKANQEARAPEPVAPRRFDELTPIEAAGAASAGAALPAASAPPAPFAGPLVPGVKTTSPIPLAGDRFNPDAKLLSVGRSRADSSAAQSATKSASYYDSGIDVDTAAPHLAGLVGGASTGASTSAAASADALGLRPEVLAALRQSGTSPAFGGGSSTGMAPAAAPARAGSIGAELTPSATPRVRAGWMGDRNLLLGKGASIPCGLGTALDSSVSGFTTCTVSRNVFSENGKVLLIERGSHIDGEYVGGMKVGQQRMFVLWDRIRTTRGVTIDISSPAADALGRSGLEGQVDSHWWARIGGAFMLSLVQDAVGIVAAKEAGTSGNASGGTQLFSNTQQTGESLAAKVLASTINIAPTFSKKQGDRVNVIVARDLDFGGVYGLAVE